MVLGYNDWGCDARAEPNMFTLGIGPSIGWISDHAASRHIMQTPVSTLTRVNMLRRHSDKGREMTLLPLADYGEAAERLAMHNPLGMKRAAFVSSEDPDVIRVVQNLTDFGTPGVCVRLPEFSLDSTSIFIQHWL